VPSQIKGVNTALPGSFGINTQSEIVADDATRRFVSDAANGIIDKSGKLVSREDFVLQTTGSTAVIDTVFTHRNVDGTETIMSAGDGVIASGITTLTSRHTYTGDDNWQFASLTGRIHMAQKGQTFKVLNETTFANVALVGAPWTGSPNVVLAADGRVWVADDEAGGNSYTLWWSNLLDGVTYNTGDAGSLDVRKVWPEGQDSIVAVAFLSSRLVIFGKNNILLYTLPADHNPANMSLTDSISGLGCIARDSVVLAGGDLYFLADSGYYMLPKLAQLTSMLSAVKVSANAADDVVSTFAAEDLKAVRAGYFSREKIITLAAPVSNKTWVFNVERKVPSAANDQERVTAATYWTNSAVAFRGFCHDKNGNYYCAMRNGIGKYTGYTSDGASNAYSFDVYSLWDAMGDETREKIMKALAMTMETNVNQAFTLRWQFDYKAGTTRTASVTASATEFAEAPGVGVIKSPIGGAGTVVRYGFTTTIAGNKVTYHSVRPFAVPGSTKIR